VIAFESFPKQQQFIEAAFDKQHKYILYGGGIRGGKTYAGLAAILLLCRVYPGSRWAIVRDSLPTLKRNTIPSFNKLVPTSFIKSYNQDTQVVTCINGSQIIFFAENYDDDKELNRWKGLEVNGFLLEECNELQEVSFYKAIERAGSHVPVKGKKAPIKILLTCNPSWGWVKTKFYDPWKKNEMHKDYMYIHALVTDNPVFANDPEYMESLKNLPHMEYEIYVKGNWDINLNEHPWLYAFRDEQHKNTHIRKLPFMQTEPVYLTFDINAEPLSCTAWQRSRKMGLWAHCIREFGGHIKVDDICQQIRSAFPNTILYVTGDRSGQNQDVGRNQTIYQMIQAHLGLSDRQMNLNTHNLEHADSRLLCNTIFEHYPIFIDPSCVNLIADCRKATVDMESVRGNQLLKDRGDYKMDYFDGMRYFFQTYFLQYIRDNYLILNKQKHGKG